MELFFLGIPYETQRSRGVGHVQCLKDYSILLECPDLFDSDLKVQKILEAVGEPGTLAISKSQTPFHIRVL